MDANFWIRLINLIVIAIIFVSLSLTICHIKTIELEKYKVEMQTKVQLEQAREKEV